MLSVVLNLWVVVGGELSVDLDCDKALRQDYSHFAHLEFHISILLFHSFNIGGDAPKDLTVVYFSPILCPLFRFALLLELVVNNY
jgi:hypothetical protein